MPHINKLIDFTVVAYVVHDNKVLLIFHRALQKWLPLGGHIELDENPEQALFREVKEESGLDIEVLAEKPANEFSGRTFLYAPSFLDIHDIEGGHRHIGMTYFVRAKTENVSLAEKEHEDIRWFTEDDLADPKFKVPEDVQFIARQALDKAR